MDFATVAFVFPGQGSQVVGMCQDIAAAYPVVAETLQEANDLLGYDLGKLMFDGPEDALNDTVNTQPALYVASIALLRVLQQELPDAKPAFTAGHSLGEFSALTASQALPFADGLRLVRERGRLMKEAGVQNPGGMAALLGISLEKATQLVQAASEKTGHPVVVANDNCPGQIVISGHQDALDRAMGAAKEYGAKRAVPLAVSVATHSPLMVPAKEAFSEFIHAIQFDEPHIPIYANVSAQPMHSVEDIYTELEAQLTSTVHWTQSVQNMIAAGVTTFVEIGPKDVLTGLLRRINRDTIGKNINDLSSLRAFLQENA